MPSFSNIPGGELCVVVDMAVWSTLVRISLPT